MRRRTSVATFVHVRALPTRRRVVGTVGAALLLMTAAACSSESDDATAAPDPTVDEATATPTDPPSVADEPAPAPNDSSAPDGSAPTAVVPEALRFSAPLVGGGTFDGAATAGKPTVFWFWAPT